MSNCFKIHAINTELSEWITAFLIDRQAGNLSPSTIRFYRACLSKFTAFCSDIALTTPEMVNADHFRRFLLWLEAQGHNAGGIHAHYRICKTFYRSWVIESDTRDYNEIFRKVGAPRLDDTPLPPVPLEDVNAMVKVCGMDWHGRRDRAAILALSEFLSFNADDINMRTGASFIRNGKGNKSRTVFIGKTARRALRRYLRTRNMGALWTIQDGDRISYQGLRAMIRRRAALAGVEPPTPHDFRRAFAVNMLRAGVDLETLRRLMGHSDLQVLRRYLDLRDSDLQRAHAIASPADQLRNINKRR